MDDDHYIHRRNRRGIPIKVLPEERDKFVEGFIKARQRATWAMMTAMAIVCIAAAAIFSDADAPGTKEFIYIGVGGLMAGFFILWRWSWNAPARALGDRQSQGPALEKDDARRTSLKRMRWGQFAWAGLAVVIGAAALASQIDLLSGWNRLWLVGGALYAVLLSWRMWQKWEADQSSE